MSKSKVLPPKKDPHWAQYNVKGLRGARYSTSTDYGISKYLTEDSQPKYISPIKTSKPRQVSVTGESKITQSVLEKHFRFNVSKIRERTPMNYINRAQDYKTADAFILEDDQLTRTLLTSYLERHVIKRDDENDEGRKIKVESCENGEELIDRIVNKGETFGFITVDYLLGCESPSGRDTIRQLRNAGYEGCIVYLTSLNGLMDPAVEQHLIEVGADALILKGSENMTHEFKRLIGDLIVRDKNW